MKNIVFMCSIALAAVAQSASFTVSRVTVQQRWPWSQKVDVDYLLESSDGSLADISVELYDGDTKLAVPYSALSGDCADVAPGFRRLTFDPSASGLEATVYRSFNVRVSASEVPLYLVVDLTKSYGDEGLIASITADQLKSGAYGTYETNPVEGIESLIWTGVTNDATYATEKLVLRRVAPGSFKMGGGHQGASGETYKRAGAYPATNLVTLTRPYYIGVFEMTQAQWKNIKGSYPSSYYRLNRDRRPCERVFNDTIRGTGVNWPATGYDVDGGSVMKALRDKTGMIFDLPTEAQWEYAARAGVETAYSDNYDYGNVRVNELADGDAPYRIRLLGRFKTNGGGTKETSDSGGASVDVTNGTAIVGSYAPNAFGLYDVHGNVREIVLDYMPLSNPYWTYPGTDPAGCSEADADGVNRIQKGGCHLYDELHGNFGHRWSASKSGNNQTGFRVIAYPFMVTPVVGDIRD